MISASVAVADCFFAFLLSIYQMIPRVRTGGEAALRQGTGPDEDRLHGSNRDAGFLDCRLSSTALVTRSHTPLLEGGQATFKPNTEFQCSWSYP
jgi:hypothetical protein